jgi:hypothetical protein
MLKGSEQAEIQAVGLVWFALARERDVDRRR